MGALENSNIQARSFSIDLLNLECFGPSEALSVELSHCSFFHRITECSFLTVKKMHKFGNLDLFHDKLTTKKPCHH